MLPKFCFNIQKDSEKSEERLTEERLILLGEMKHGKKDLHPSDRAKHNPEEKFKDFKRTESMQTRRPTITVNNVIFEVK